MQPKTWYLFDTFLMEDFSFAASTKENGRIGSTLCVKFSECFVSFRHLYEATVRPWLVPILRHLRSTKPLTKLRITSRTSNQQQKENSINSTVSVVIECMTRLITIQRYGQKS
jgi:hypothetical protein